MSPEKLINTTVGSIVMFQCEAKTFGSEQALQYFWVELTDNITMTITDESTRILEFVATSNDDSTFYQCGATNENNTVLSSIGRLNCKYMYIVSHVFATMLL